MNTTASDTPPEVPLTWTRKAEWGYDTPPHNTEVTINGERWHFHVGYHGSHNWVARGWRNGAFAMYRETRTMKAAKAEVQAMVNYAATQTCPDCLKIGGHEMECIVLAKRVAQSPAAVMSDIKDTVANLALVVRRAATSMSKLVYGVTRTCPCPTPTHRMSCGVGATPKVVQS